MLDRAEVGYVSRRHGRAGSYDGTRGSTASRRPGRTLTRLLAVVTVGFLVVGLIGPITPLSYVNSGSMSPTLSTGDGFVAVPGPVADEPEPGDVVVYRSEAIEPGALVTHRVVGETEDGYVTKGDANPVTDQQAGEPPVTRDRVVATALTVDGRVVVIPGLGSPSMAFRSALEGLNVPTRPLEAVALGGGAALLWRGRWP